VGVTWDDRVAALFEDLEMQADGLYLDDRDREVEALAEAGYAEVALADRLHGSVGRRLRVALSDGSEATGVLRRCGAGWLLLATVSGDWLVPVSAVVLVDGLAPGSVPAAARPRTARLSVGSVLRRLAEDATPCALSLRGERQVRGVLVRVGSDFVVVRSRGADLDVPLAALIAVRSER